jgi:hypothetical protein
VPRKRKNLYIKGEQIKTINTELQHNTLKSFAKKKKEHNTLKSMIKTINIAHSTAAEYPRSRRSKPRLNSMSQLISCTTASRTTQENNKVKLHLEITK